MERFVRPRDSVVPTVEDLAKTLAVGFAHPVAEVVDRDVDALSHLAGPEVRGPMPIRAWPACNRHTVRAEQRLVDRTFAYVVEGEFPSLDGPAPEASLAQAMRASDTTR